MLRTRRATQTEAFDGIVTEERQFRQVRDEDIYEDLCRTMPAASFLRVRRGKVYRCDMGGSQHKLTPHLLQCVPSRWGSGGCVTWQGQPVGEIVVHGGSWFRSKRMLEFRVNDRAIMTMQVYNIQRDQPCQYVIKVANAPVLRMAVPRWVEKRQVYMLRYLLLDTKQIGVESCKNFSLRNRQDKAVLECVKSEKNALMVAIQPPFNPVLGAVIGFMRFLV